MDRFLSLGNNAQNKRKPCEISESECKVPIDSRKFDGVINQSTPTPALYLTAGKHLAKGTPVHRGMLW